MGRSERSLREWGRVDSRSPWQHPKRFRLDVICSPLILRGGWSGSRGPSEEVKGGVQAGADGSLDQRVAEGLDGRGWTQEGLWR